MTEEELRKMTVKDLRKIAAEQTELSGITGMKKDVLIEALVKELNIKQAKKQATGKALDDKISTKREILRLKQKKDDLLKQKSKKPAQLKNIRRRVRNLKKHLRKIG